MSREAEPRRQPSMYQGSALNLSSAIDAASPAPRNRAQARDRDRGTTPERPAQLQLTLPPPSSSLNERLGNMPNLSAMMLSQASGTDVSLGALTADPMRQHHHSMLEGIYNASAPSNLLDSARIQFSQAAHGAILSVYFDEEYLDHCHAT